MKFKPGDEVVITSVPAICGKRISIGDRGVIGILTLKDRPEAERLGLTQVRINNWWFWYAEEDLKLYTPAEITTVEEARAIPDITLALAVILEFVEPYNDVQEAVCERARELLRICS